MLKVNLSFASEAAQVAMGVGVRFFSVNWTHSERTKGMKEKDSVLKCLYP